MSCASPWRPSLCVLLSCQPRPLLHHALQLSPCRCVAPYSSSGSAKTRNTPPNDSSAFRDTRIHWKSDDEGWIGFSNGPGYSLPPGTSSTAGAEGSRETGIDSVLTDLLGSLISQASYTHYQYTHQCRIYNMPGRIKFPKSPSTEFSISLDQQCFLLQLSKYGFLLSSRFLGVSPNAELEEIKIAYRKLSKLYHPDSTSLPLDVAANKFVSLKEAYSVLSSVEKRQFYDWTLAQKVSREQGGRFIWPYEADWTQRVRRSRPRPQQSENHTEVDALGAPNMKLSNQAQTAITFDFLVLLFSICCIIYVSFFKHG